VHHIQLKILRKLLYSNGGNYAALRPEGIESNHYAYHLEQLIRDGLVYKDDKTYRLTPDGLALVDRMNPDNLVRRLQPNIVTAIDLTTPDGKTLLFQRNLQPYIDLIGFPKGRLHLDEELLPAAERELFEKTGLEHIPLTHRGMAYVDAKQNGETVSKVLYHVFHGEVACELAVSLSSDRGRCFWADIRTIPPDHFMPGFLALKRALQESDTLFFLELTETLPPESDVKK
jgi:8-oxo-dGTP pyrophosphatase MutT (NUDIX family)